MGHEMSHVILRHGKNQAGKPQSIELPAIPEEKRPEVECSALTQLGTGLGANSVLQSFHVTGKSG